MPWVFPHETAEFPVEPPAVDVHQHRESYFLSGALIKEPPWCFDQTLGIGHRLMNRETEASWDWVRSQGKLNDGHSIPLQGWPVRHSKNPGRPSWGTTSKPLQLANEATQPHAPS